jgi:cytochrome c biogenesis protein CcdA
MLLRFAADAVLVVHLLFVLFVLLGGLLVLRSRWLAWWHLPAVAWGALVELARLQCPLTPLENALRRGAGEQGFIEYYLLPILYPAGLTPQIQLWLGVFVLALNALVYTALLWRLRREH